MKIAIVNMPFYSIIRPSIQLGILKSVLTEAGYHAQDFYFNLEFSKRFDDMVYEALCRHRGILIGEWLFAKAAFQLNCPPQHDDLIKNYKELFIKEFKNLGWNDIEKELKHIRDNIIPDFLNYLINSIDWGSFDVVGFSSTFEQNVSSIALAKRIKEKFPKINIILGGSNMDDHMGIELLRKTKEIDYIIMGRGEDSLIKFLEGLKKGDLRGIKGLYSKRSIDDLPKLIPADPKPLDSIPIPDYSAFFETAKTIGLIKYNYQKNLIKIPFESSTGCWWGEKQHCVFCGLNADSMSFKSKSPEKVKEELIHQTKKYQSFNFEAVDNIMDFTYLKKLIPELISINSDYSIFYEIKSNINREQIKLLSLSGVKKVQPGIESLSSSVLKLMKKGVSGIQNVVFLKWTKYYGIETYWNILWGFPGEKTEYIEEQNQVISNIYHLQPPIGYGRIWMERFSPIYANESAYPKKHMTPHFSYQYIYPENYNLDKIAYFFSYELVDTLDDDNYEILTKNIDKWQSSFDQDINSLTFSYSPGMVRVEDFRINKENGIYIFEDPIDELFLLCNDTPKTISYLNKYFKGDKSELPNLLDELIQMGLFIKENDQYLNVCLPKSENR
ncbi:RiPP maturation radical SAM C-methyltransferase [Marinoscillum pacificum]|uniref:RiPP maturation radical SAM C-methyltransferase n=1 Tax=Marinoscillum pacificum TaxID=392723 RepID=UPI0021574EF6|nr:RiPP maturation radical SAM C-methyltransferase [Marinoscillum pacificum]